MNDTLVICDTHLGKFTNPPNKNAIDKLINRLLITKCKELIIAGDFIDLLRNINFGDILKGLKNEKTDFSIIDIMVNKFKKIRYIPGNHDDLIAKYLSMQLQVFSGWANYFDEKRISSIVEIYGETGFATRIGEKTVQFLHGHIFDSYWLKYKPLVTDYLKGEGFFYKLFKSNKQEILNLSQALDKSDSGMNDMIIKSILTGIFSGVFASRDIIIMGHMHKPGVWEEKGKLLYCAGDFYNHAVCIEIIDNKINIIDA